MAKLIWSDQAISDLEGIGDFIGQDSEKFAKITVKKLFERALILKTFPTMGRIVPEKNSSKIRELIEGNYRIIYEIISELEIHILTIHHSRPDL